jgi:hypothetical protein
MSTISGKGIDPHAIPSLQVLAGVTAAFATSNQSVSPNPKVTAHYISDFQHAALAVPYYDALFCDHGMAAVLQNKPLEFGKVYNTVILSRTDEIREFLLSLAQCTQKWVGS